MGVKVSNQQEELEVSFLTSQQVCQGRGGARGSDTRSPPPPPPRVVSWKGRGEWGGAGAAPSPALSGVWRKGPYRMMGSLSTFTMQ